MSYCESSFPKPSNLETHKSYEKHIKSVTTGKPFKSKNYLCTLCSFATKNTWL